MKKGFKNLALTTLLLAAALGHAQQKQQDIDKKVDALIAKMTLEEKVGQMAQITLDVLCKGDNRFSSTQPLTLDDAEMKKVFGKYHIGSVLNIAGGQAVTPQKWYELISGVQKASLATDKNKIPVLYGVDEIHGATYTDGATMFPQEIAQAAARNPKLTELGASITAYETRASNIPWTFSPVLDLGMDPRFPRQWESFGEDPYLCSVLGVAMVHGFEGNNIGDAQKVASCIKHFLGYHAATSGKDRTPAYISEDALREYHLPSFKAAIEAGAQTIMINSGVINGVPVHANYDILTKLLKDELGFKGLVVTDWADIENLHKRDRMAASDKEAIVLAINAGIDMSMIPYQYEVFCDNLIALVKEGKVKQERIDDAVRRILKVKYALNLFDKPNTNPKDYPKFGSKEHQKASYDMAAEAITLLKNEGNVLPLKKNIKVLITGPNANSMRTLNGGWTYTWQGDKTDQYAAKYNTIVEAVENEIGKANVTYIPGVSYKAGGHYYDELADKMDEAVAAAKNADVILLCLGENSYTEKPGDMNDLYMSDLQTELAQKIATTGKTVILILNEGRPRLISKFESNIKGIVQSYLPGNFGGDAIADVLFGDVNPSGKLPYTYPRYPNATISYIHKPSEEQKKAEGVYNYEADYNPQYAFGHGLSYTTFSYKDLKVNKASVKKGENVQITIVVTNTGKVAGKEVVHLFTSDLYATSVTPDVKRLRRFEKIDLKPGESKIVTFELNPKDLTYVGRDGKDILEAGDFEISIEKLKATFTLSE
ncbi:glycoside hydrolase family 3 N-terminal domain-containing protein [Flavobacterium subsaxonicum]|uniref:beta-glucosidase n=1 Tax=Flavobacterium subsaxonicum WB 4.1-42 = DSM 21790 TaxID=1121898 RepID=A0A0A2MIC9_9FLAO|nr:glycoside hydrolase family 3 N-terminal domain-containing protein [Flavobacterium subsaxonicum]KGO91346.1 glycoside hydrolase family 3 [Flavobacterium subsaxonicum WB 4.1-42 = DSM 21790]